jgi:hypothetical protein
MVSDISLHAYPIIMGAAALEAREFPAHDGRVASNSSSVQGFVLSMTASLENKTRNV